jgi:hypothetical protein
MDNRVTFVGWDCRQIPERVGLRGDYATAHLAHVGTQSALCGADLQVLTPQLTWQDIPNAHRCRSCAEVPAAA